MLSPEARHKPWFRRKRVWLLLIGLILLLLLSSCAGTRALMMTAPSKPKGQPATPPIPSQTLSDWESQKPNIQRKFEHEVYGVMPRDFGSKTISSKLIAESAFGGTARVEETRIRALNYGSEFPIVILTPNNVPGPVPIIMMENFCPNDSVIPITGLSKPKGAYFDCSQKGIMGSVFGYFFGRYITTPPIEMIMKGGYAVAVVYPSDTFPDSASNMALYEKAPNPEHRWGAVAAWAYQFSVLSQYLDQDPRFSKTISYGHSRYGKSALLSAAFDPNIDGVIAHQSGTGGASLSRNKPGETVASITQAYPHWFTPPYDEATLTIDQHYLLALIAPRPILLGNAKRDVWSDPNGAFNAAMGADRVYEIYGGVGLDQERLTDFNPKADIAFWMRPGTHGVVKEDWPAFLEFLDAHFK